MVDLTLVLGNRNYSSWSLRAWLALEESGLPYKEEMVWFDQDQDRRHRLRHSPTGKVPTLLVDGEAVWDSLAIGETLAELAPGAGLWPDRARARRRARSLCAEMHAGFPRIREKMPMNVRGRTRFRDRGADVAAEIARVTGMWEETRREYGGSGPFLFGDWSLADAFYTPMASRFRTYGVELPGAAAAWSEAALGTPAMQKWSELAAAETHTQPAYDALLDEAAG